MRAPRDEPFIEGFCVVRQDDNGNLTVMAHNLTEEQARAMAEAFGGRGHKQSYWVQPHLRCRA